MSGPITPDEVSTKHTIRIPETVFEVFNELIAKDWNGHSATVKQDEAAKLICERLKIDTGKLYGERWMDVEEEYREAGWGVVYDKPGYNETYPATYRFSK